MPSFRSPSFFLLLAGAASAQTPAPAPAHVHDEPVTLNAFVTSASPFGRNQIDLAQSTTVLSGRTLLLKQQPTLGETLAAEPGMTSTAFGPGASRPIIRGLGGDRIRLLENGVGTIDASVTSPDHAVSVEPFLVERIEVVRGPASLLYGANAVGGVVNVITHRIETELPAERVRGAAELRAGSAADEFARSGVLDLAVLRNTEHAVVLHLDAFRRSTSDARIPGFAESGRVRAAEAAEAREHGEPTPEFARGRLPNSALDTQGGAAGLSIVGKNFHVGASYNGLDSDYGVPGHAHKEDAAPGDAAGVRIELRQRRTDVQAEWRDEGGPIEALRFKLGRARYRHAEREPDGAIGTVFSNRGHDARLEALHGGAAGWSGALGAQAASSDFAAAGEEAFLPSSRTRSAALFAFEEVARGPLTWQFGARVERTRISAEARPSRTARELSGSLGAVWKLGAAHALALSLAHTGRAPNAQELYADGPHAGTASFELGDATLRPERSLGAELSLRRTTGAITGAVTVFANRFRGFIFEQPTGLVALERAGAWEFFSPESDEARAADDALPLYRYAQRAARFHGAELDVVWHLHEAAGRRLDLRWTADVTRGRTEGGNLPRIPAARTSLGALWSRGPWSAGADCQIVFAQNRTAAGETRSDGYALASAHVYRLVEMGRATWQFFLRGSNLGNVEARPHTSFVKELAPLTGRGFTAGARVAF